jgi:hypothetical protein
VPPTCRLLNKPTFTVSRVSSIAADGDGCSWLTRTEGFPKCMLVRAAPKTVSTVSFRYFQLQLHSRRVHYLETNHKLGERTTPDTHARRAHPICTR